MHSNINDINLKDMRPGEKPVMVIKRHWIILVELFLYFLLGIIFTILFYAFLPTSLSHILNICFWIIWSMFIYIEWINHELDMYVITNNRII
jgi:hypothetical protein